MYEGGKGGKTVMVLGPKWRFHYYAHFDAIDAFLFQPVAFGTKSVVVDNMAGKLPHLHYAITTSFSYWW